MLFAAGGSLSEHLERYQADPKAAADLVEKVARAVQYAHERQILHRDLKPGNILLDERGEPLVSDFGLARFHDSSSQDVGSTRTGMLMGTPSYMSPEQFRGESLQVTEAADIWSLGVILYQLLTGRLPFGGSELMKVLFEVTTKEPPSQRTLRPDLDPALEAICLKCLQKQPADRYLSAGALADDLARWQRGESIQARLLCASLQSAHVWEASAPAASKSVRAGSWFRRLFGNRS